MNAISLFSCIGVGEYYLKDLGINVLVANELEKKRCDIYNFFYPDTKVISGDISSNKVKNQIIEGSKNNNIDLIIATPPCQGMSSVGKNRKDGTLHSDERNSLILETFDIIESVNPKYVLIENVPRFLKVKYNFNTKEESIIDILHSRFGNEYNIVSNIYNAADFGVPQVRNRLFIRLFKKGLSWDDPKISTKQITVEEAIGNLPSLESGMSSNIKNHWARIHPEKHRDLIVRVAGYSDYFNDLGADLQEEIIRRTAHETA